MILINDVNKFFERDMIHLNRQGAFQIARHLATRLGQIEKRSSKTGNPIRDQPVLITLTCSQIIISYFV